MALPDFSESKPERPFEGMKIYFSGPIVVAEGGDLNLNWDFVQFMKEKGARVLSEHVGGRNLEERTELFRRNTGEDQSDDAFVRRADLGWVDESDCVVAVINKSSFGVGMEIQRAIDKPGLGMNPTPVLCLLSNDIIARQSKMITGITGEENPGFKLVRYGTVEEAKTLINDFLLSNK
jgi:hypothetical protein